jgi:hypothetical protein
MMILGKVCRWIFEGYAACADPTWIKVHQAHARALQRDPFDRGGTA